MFIKIQDRLGMEKEQMMKFYEIMNEKIAKIFYVVPELQMSQSNS